LELLEKRRASQGLLRFHFQPENQAKWVEAGHGSIAVLEQPDQPSGLQERPAVPAHSRRGQGHGPTVLARADHPAASQQVWDLYLIPDMFAQYATGRMTLDQAISWGEKRM